MKVYWAYFNKFSQVTVNIRMCVCIMHFAFMVSRKPNGKHYCPNLFILPKLPLLTIRMRDLNILLRCLKLKILCIKPDRTHISLYLDILTLL